MNNKQNTLQDITKKYKKLQNGSDIRGVATCGVKGENVNLTPAVACNIAKGFVGWLAAKSGKAPENIKISIGMDPRITGPDLKTGFICGLKSCSENLQVLDCDLASTPAMFMSIIFPETKCDGAIMITASHLPFNRNGFKFFDKDGGLNKSDITDILARAAQIAFTSDCCGESDDSCCDSFGSPNDNCCSNISDCCGDTHDSCCRNTNDTCCKTSNSDSICSNKPSDNLVCCEENSCCGSEYDYYSGKTTAEKFDLMTLYCDHLKNLIIKNLSATDNSTIKSSGAAECSCSSTDEAPTAQNSGGALSDQRPSAHNSGSASNTENTTSQNMCTCSTTYDNQKPRKTISSAESYSGSTAYDNQKPLKGLKIVVDAGNGAGGFFATRILEPLGADISGSQFLDPDGNFPNHQPNPENKDAMAAISKAVIENNADLGLIFDTDVDRSAAVDSQGNEISRNGIVALAAALVSEKHPGTTVVTDSITSDQLTVFLEQTLGLKHLRFKRGYKNVINKAIELNNEGIESALAIETSGHAAIKDNYFLDDGAYLATLIVIKTASLSRYGKEIDSVIADLDHPLEAKEIRIPILGDDFAETADKVLEKIKTYFDGDKPITLHFLDFKYKIIDPDDDEYISEISILPEIVQPNFEGVRISFKIITKSGKGLLVVDTPGKLIEPKIQTVYGWCLLRKSLHDPLIPMNVESNFLGGVKLISELICDLLMDDTSLDLSVFI